MAIPKPLKTWQVPSYVSPNHGGQLKLWTKPYGIWSDYQRKSITDYLSFDCFPQIA